MDLSWKLDTNLIMGIKKLDGGNDTVKDCNTILQVKIIESTSHFYMICDINISVFQVPFGGFACNQLHYVTDPTTQDLCNLPKRKRWSR